MLTVRIRQTTQPQEIKNDLVVSISANAKIANLQKLIRDHLHVEESKQKLYFSGKELFHDQFIMDYKVNDNDVIQLLVKNNHKVEEDTPQCDETIADNNLIVSSVSKYYEVGDAVDVVYNELGAWFEAKIVGIFVDQNTQNVNEEDLIFRVVMDRNEQTAPIDVNFLAIRPRASFVYQISQLKPEMVVFVNYNLDKPKKRGYWYDFKITKVDNQVLQGIIIRGRNHEDLDNCKIEFKDEVMKVETPTLKSERVHKIHEVPLRKLPLYCDKCKDVASRDCKECSCNICGKKKFIDQLIICDECECTYHLFCLKPPLTEIPTESEWYCPDCKTDENEIVKAGEKLKTINNKSYVKTCREQTSILKNNFGPIFGIDVGTCWNSRWQIFQVGIHGSYRSDIHGVEKEGVYSIILNENNEDTKDNGEEFYYTISEGRNASHARLISIKLSSQLSNKMIKILALNCDNHKFKNNGFGRASVWRRGKPVRVIRSGEQGRSSKKFAPKLGYRYDGIYKVVEYFPDIDRTGSIIWRYLMRRDDPTPPPWATRSQIFEPKRDEKRVLDSPDLTTNSNKKIKIESFPIDVNIKRNIDADSLNEKLWNECLITAVKGRCKFLQKVKELFTCVCCHEIVYMPVTTNCKHNICRDCLIKCFASEIYNCPSCRLELEKKHILIINQNLEAALKLLFPGYGFNR